MNKLFLSLILLISFSCFAKDMKINVCNDDNCYTYTIQNAKSFEYIKSYLDTKYLRIELTTGEFVDINVQNKTVEIKK